MPEWKMGEEPGRGRREREGARERETACTCKNALSKDRQQGVRISSGTQAE